MREPTTTLTDYILAIEAAVLAALLARSDGAAQALAPWLWALGFAALAFAAASGGTAHGFAHRFGEAGGRRLWLASLGAVALAGSLWVAAAVFAALGPPLRNLVLALVLVRLALGLRRLPCDAAFRAAAKGFGLDLALVLALQALAWQRFDAASAPWIAAGIALAGLGGWVQAREIAPHPRFNHNDLFHVILMLALLPLYLGGLRLADAP